MTTIESFYSVKRTEEFHDVKPSEVQIENGANNFGRELLYLNNDDCIVVFWTSSHVQFCSLTGVFTNCLLCEIEDVVNEDGETMELWVAKKELDINEDSGNPNVYLNLLDVKNIQSRVHKDKMSGEKWEV